MFTIFDLIAIAGRGGEGDIPGNGSRIPDPGDRGGISRPLGRYSGKSHNQKDLEKNVWFYEHINIEWAKLLTVSWWNFIIVLGHFLAKFTKQWGLFDVLFVMFESVNWYFLIFLMGFLYDFSETHVNVTHLMSTNGLFIMPLACALDFGGSTCWLTEYIYIN